MERHRIDHWLKLVCLYKQRGDAAEACRAGHVKINGQRAKPSATLKEGDVVEFYLADRFRRVIAQGFPTGSVAKEVARTMYIDESPEPQRVTIDMPEFRERGAGRPTKKDRRLIHKFKT